MTTIAFTCPIDGLAMWVGVATVDATKTDRDARVGGHIHLGVDEVMSCLNGHQWTFQGDFILARTG